MNPQLNLGLQLCVETVDGTFARFIILQINVRLLELREGHEVTPKTSAFDDWLLWIFAVHQHEKSVNPAKNNWLCQNYIWKRWCPDKTPAFSSLFLLTLILFSGRSLSIKSAGLVGRNGPQSKQPFLVAFFKASGVLLRSVRAAGGKKKNNSRNKSTNQQETSRAPKPGGTVSYSPSAPQSSDFRALISLILYPQLLDWVIILSLFFVWFVTKLGRVFLPACEIQSVWFLFWFFFSPQITTQATRSKPARNMNCMSVFGTWAGRWDRKPN